MATDEIEALAKQLADVKPHENVPFTCYRGAAALRHLMARVSELEKERDKAFNDGLEAGARTVAGIQQHCANQAVDCHPSRASMWRELSDILEITTADIRSLKRPQEAT